MITIKLIKGRHFYDRLYKAGIIYHVQDEVGVALLAYKNVDKTPRFKRMVKRSEIEAASEESTGPMRPVELVKRKPGRPKKSPVVNKVVDETPIEVKPKPVTAPKTDSLKGVVLEQDLEEADFVEEDPGEPEAEVEVYEDDDKGEVQTYGDDV